ncbi:MAG: hypothetical protein ACXACI_08445 [Candidatus Hodarchaeales archaeon]
MTNKLSLCAWLLAICGLIELIVFPVWESLLILHVALAGMSCLFVLTSSREKTSDIVTLGNSTLAAGRSGLTLFAIAFPWMITAMFVISLKEYSQLETLYGPNAPVLGLAGLLAYPFIPIFLSPRKEYYNLLYQKFRHIILEPAILEEFLTARNDEKKMEKFTLSFFPEIYPLYKENKDFIVTLEFFSLFRNLEAKLKDDPGFAPILKSFQRV